jgi:hypothetical protein
LGGRNIEEADAVYIGIGIGIGETECPFEGSVYYSG